MGLQGAGQPPSPQLRTRAGEHVEQPLISDTRSPPSHAMLKARPSQPGQDQGVCSVTNLEHIFARHALESPPPGPAQQYGQQQQESRSPQPPLPKGAAWL